jgi:hypothetical protein
MWKKTAVAYFKVLYLYLPGKTNENHEKSQKEEPAYGEDSNPEFPKYGQGVLMTMPLMYGQTEHYLLKL